MLHGYCPSCFFWFQLNNSGSCSASEQRGGGGAANSYFFRWAQSERDLKLFASQLTTLFIFNGLKRLRWINSNNLGVYTIVEQIKKASNNLSLCPHNRFTSECHENTLNRFLSRQYLNNRLTWCSGFNHVFYDTGCHFFKDEDICN